MKNALYDLRRNAGYLSQEDLAKAVGAKRAAISKWESGKTCPRISTIAKLADLLHCSTDDIIAAITAAKEAG